MIAAPLPLNEAERLAILRRFEILDTPAEPLFDDIATVAATICDTPIALITLVDEGRQWFKARIGLEGSETSRDEAFCAHAILDSAVMQVPDATRDRRFEDNPYVTGEPSVRFYAGAPLDVGDGVRLGTLCVIDRQPRQLTARQEAALQALSRQVVALLEHRRVAADLASALERVRTLSGLLPICAYCKKVREDDAYWTSVESYVRARADVQFSHGICPSCAEAHWGEYLKD